MYPSTGGSEDALANTAPPSSVAVASPDTSDLNKQFLIQYRFICIFYNPYAIELTILHTLLRVYLILETTIHLVPATTVAVIKI